MDRRGNGGNVFSVICGSTFPTCNICKTAYRTAMFFPFGIINRLSVSLSFFLEILEILLEMTTSKSIPFKNSRNMFGSPVEIGLMGNSNKFWFLNDLSFSECFSSSSAQIVLSGATGSNGTKTFHLILTRFAFFTVN